MFSFLRSQCTSISAQRFSNNSRRFLSIHEHQSLQLFKTFGVGVPKTEYVDRVSDISKIWNRSFKNEKEGVVLKAQVLAGGRGKGQFVKSQIGGVQMCADEAEAASIASKMIGDILVTKQTGAKGKPCNGVLVSEKFKIVDEKYFAILMDRESGGPLLIGSKFGGMSIEEVAEEHPEAIIKMQIPVGAAHLSRDLVSSFCEKIGYSSNLLDAAIDNVSNLYKMFADLDVTMLEINPLATTDDNRVIVCDAKVNFDDNASFRHPEVWNMRDSSQEDPREVEAANWDLNYIGLDGSVGCMVNGAGLAMATMDLLDLFGGSPANFLDVGGSASVDQVRAAFKVLKEDDNVKSILVNIFGGIMRCDVIAEGIVVASKELKMDKPIVVRLVGTNVDIGKKILEDSGLAVFSIDDLNQAAKKAVELAA